MVIIIKNHKEVNLRVLIFCIIFISISIILILITFIGNWINNEIWQLLIRELASLLLISGTISLVWELWLRRNFLDEVLHRVNLRRDLLDTGVVKINPSFMQIDNKIWEDFFSSVSELDIFFCYGRTWLRNQRENFNKLIQRQNLKFRVIIPNPEHIETMKVLAKRFNYEIRKLVELTNESIKFFKEYKENHNLPINLWLIEEPPLYSMYRFNNVIIFALFPHRDDVSVPTFFYESPGSLYKYYIEEFEKLISKSVQIC